MGIGGPDDIRLLRTIALRCCHRKPPFYIPGPLEPERLQVETRKRVHGNQRVALSACRNMGRQLVTSVTEKF